MDYDIECQDQTDHQKLAKAAMECLTRVPYPAIRRISCTFRGGVLSLQGRLPDYYHKQLAQEAVLRLPGVVRVVNETEVVVALG
jgi:hypothetical protein